MNRVLIILFVLLVGAPLELTAKQVVRHHVAQAQTKKAATPRAANPNCALGATPPAGTQCGISDLSLRPGGALQDTDTMRLCPDATGCFGGEATYQDAQAPLGSLWVPYIRSKFSAGSGLTYNSSTGALGCSVAASGALGCVQPPGGTGSFLRGDGTWATPAGGGGGTVTSVTCTAPLTGGTFTTAGSCGLGNVPVTNLAGGSGATSSTFWRGDGTWATPPTGSGGGVNSGTLGQMAYYGATGAVVSGNSHLSDTGSQFQLNYNTTVGTIPTFAAKPDLRVTGLSTGLTGIASMGFSTPGALIAARAEDTGGTATAVPSGQLFGGVNLMAYDGANPMTTSGNIVAFSTEAFSTGHHGTRLALRTTPTGSTTLTDVVGFENDGGITVPPTVTGGDKGVGTINATGLFVNGVAVSGGGTTTITLDSGLASNPTVYNPGTQTVTNGGKISPQLTYEAHATSCAVNSTCGSANDGGKLLTATGPGVNWALPAPGVPGTVGFSFGYDGNHPYSLSTGSGTIYGNCGTAGTTVSAIAFATSVTTDGTNWQCIPFGGGSGGGGGLAVLPQYLAGLIPSNDTVTPNTIIDVTKGLAANDTNTLMLVLSNNFKKSIPGTVWASGSGNSCQDVTGPPSASAWYYLFIISNAAGTTVDILCSTSITAPVLPSTYTLKRWIGEFATDSSRNIRRFTTVDGHLIRWTVPTYTTSTATTTQTLTTLDLPPGINVEPLCRVSMSNASPPASVIVTDPIVADSPPSTAVPFTTAPGWDLLDVTLTAGTMNANCPRGILTNTLAQVATHASAASTTLNFVNRGFIQ